MQIIRLVTALLLFTLSTGCTTPMVAKKPSCAEINWFERGRQDGMQGQPSNNWTMTARDCAKMSGLEIQQYTDGWNHGLSLFCTENHGFLAAKAGQPYSKTCPEKYEDDFLKGYQRGLRVFLVEKETTQITSRIENIQQELKKENMSATQKVEIEKEMNELDQRRQGNLKTLERINNSFAR